MTLCDPVDSARRAPDEGRAASLQWRFVEGLNLRRLESLTFDPVLLLQGSAAVPCLEDGEIARAATWSAFADAFGGDFFYYAIRID